MKKKKESKKYIIVCNGEPVMWTDEGIIYDDIKDAEDDIREYVWDMQEQGQDYCKEEDFRVIEYLGDLEANSAYSKNSN